jgi:hypothetical protein
MEGTTELTIVAQSEDEFFELVDRVESLSDVIVRVAQGNARLSIRAVSGFMENDDDLTVRIQFDARVLRILNIVNDGMQALVAVEGLTKH